MGRITDPLALFCAVMLAGAAGAQQRAAGNGGVAIVGNVTNSKVTVGFSAAQVKELVAAANGGLLSQNKALQRDKDELGRQLSLRGGALDTFLREMGVRKVPDDKLLETLADIAARFRSLQQEVARTASSSPEVTALRAKAQAALDADPPRLDEAAQLLGQVQDIQRREARPVLAQLETTAAQQADVARTQLKYREAADHYAEAGRFAPDDKARAGYARAGAEVLFRLGYVPRDRQALEDAVELRRAVVRWTPRRQDPRGWATAQYELAETLSTLGTDAGVPVLQESVEAYRQALLEQPQAAMPLVWAKTQAEMGLAIGRLARRDPAAAKLEDAVTALREALKEVTAANAPDDWAQMQFNLGGILADLGKRETGTAHLEQAVTAYRQSLTIWTAEKDSFFSAIEQNKLGDALLLIGQRGGPIERLTEASAAYSAALELYKAWNVHGQAMEVTLDMCLSEALIAGRKGDRAGLEEIGRIVADARAALDKKGDVKSTQRADSVLAEIGRIRAGMKP
ncbi:hypothetical protein [Sphingomonas sp.]|uniref:hypothetical protein n=1 Tax=Sphingomonas sp. TaxID=28214 RepID=UPI000DB4C41E|nr:hypothetical protein [Sphingomonas sp.]PZU09742.1 MAG: hypothetical protein DI605_08855 [Sphingomonas sp.]